jgi:hypothetical protein
MLVDAPLGRYPGGAGAPVRSITGMPPDRGSLGAEPLGAEPLGAGPNVETGAMFDPAVGAPFVVIVSVAAHPPVCTPDPIVLLLCGGKVDVPIGGPAGAPM